MLYFLRAQFLRGWQLLIGWKIRDAISQDIAQSLCKTAQGCWNPYKEILWLPRFFVVRRLVPFFGPETGPYGWGVSNLCITMSVTLL